MTTSRHQCAEPHTPNWPQLCDTLPPFEWPRCRRVVIVSPHPDDETLGTGGLIGVALERGTPVLIVSVTDGEAAFPCPDLAQTRRAELAAAMQQLDPGRSISNVRLGLADAGLDRCVEPMTDLLTQLIHPHDLVVCPLPTDGHPDHVATSDAATAAARTVGATVRWYPVWAWERNNPDDTLLARGERLELSSAIQARKRQAVACFVSQLSGDDPVVPRSALRTLLRSFEVLVAPR